MFPSLLFFVFSFLHASFFVLCSFFFSLLPVFLGLFLPSLLCLWLYLHYLEEYSALPQPPLKDTLRERPFYLFDICHRSILGIPLQTGHYIAGSILGAYSSCLLCSIFEPQELPSSVLFKDWGKWGLFSGTLYYNPFSP